MAQTLIGRLILRMQAQGLAEGKKLTGVMADIERKARSMNAGGLASWGVAFQNNLNRLKAAPSELEAVRKSWLALNQSMDARKLSSALRAGEISTWKNQTLQHFTDLRNGHAQQMALIESRSKRWAKNMQDTVKPVLVMLGGYTAFYMAGVMGREGATASSERRREIFRQSMAGISEADQEALFARSEALGQQYPSVPITAVMEMSRAAYATMGDAERANAVLESMTRALVTMQSASGPDAAASLLRQFVRAMDNLGVNETGQLGIDQITSLIDASVKWTQLDPDFDIGDFWGFARRSKVAGPALSMDFLARAPGYMQDQGSDTTGNMLAMAFRAFVLEAVGSAGGKKYLEERDRLGIRDGDGLVDKLLFGSDPDKWVLEHLVPALARDGVDLDNNTAVATAVGKLTGNTTASGFMTKVITQREQYARLLANQERAMGLDAAERARHEDPFVGWTAFKKSLENLSAALVPIDKINAGLNALADGINRLASAGKDDPLGTALGIGAAGYGTYRAGKFAMGKLVDPFGLRTSAVALDGSAAALTRAAIALGGAGVAGGGGKIGRGGWLASILAMSGGKITFAAALAYLTDRLAQANRDAIGAGWFAKSGSTGGPARLSARSAEDASMASWLRYSASGDFADDLHNKGGPAHFDMRSFLFGKGAGEGFNFREHMGVKLRADTEAVAQELESTLSVNATPTVDTSHIDTAINKAQQLLNLLRAAGEAAVAAKSNVGSEMRRGFSDSFGVAP
jgi:hypothetical protein